MKKSIPVLSLLLLAFYSSPSFAQLAYEGSRQGIAFKVFIYNKQPAGFGKWKFQTKAVYTNGSPSFISRSSIADCQNSTIDGQVVPAVARYGYEFGLPEVFRAVCGLK